MSFELHPRLAADTSFIADWPLCRVLLMEDARYFWLILVPRLSAPSALRIASAATGTSPASADARGGDWPVEITDLTTEQRSLLMEEAARAAEIISHAGSAKLNIASLGNVVPQLHLHVVGRTPGDPAWPGPVWGHSPSVPYDKAARAARIALAHAL
jgi:diadenosine tetraphosphate (Ap4A) HIT family hydrolase